MREAVLKNELSSKLYLPPIKHTITTFIGQDRVVGAHIVRTPKIEVRVRMIHNVETLKAKLQ